MALHAVDSVRSPRPRRSVSPTLLRALRILFRRSDSRDAYVLRGIGNRFGPVLRPDLRKH
jgi:hypothetical protein